MLVGRSREIVGKGRPARGKCFGLDVSSVLANDGHADAKPQAGAAAGTLGGVEGIENAWKCFGADAHAVILNGDRNLLTVAARTDLDSAVVTNFADGLLGVGNKVQKDLNQLVGVPDDAGKIGPGVKIYLDIVAAQRMLLQLEGAIEKVIKVQGLF